MKKRLTFGVITAECYRKHTSEMIHGIIAQCTQADCNIIVLSSKNNFQEPVTRTHLRFDKSTWGRHICILQWNYTHRQKETRLNLYD